MENVDEERAKKFFFFFSFTISSFQTYFFSSKKQFSEVTEKDLEIKIKEFSIQIEELLSMTKSNPSSGQIVFFFFFFLFSVSYSLKNNLSIFSLF